MASTTFFTLPLHTRNRIDSAYLSLCRSLPDFEEPPTKKRKLATDLPIPSGGGGFIIDDPPEHELASEIETTQLPKIPISSIPSGLQLLDLPPDDDQVLSVFRQAASDWDESAAVGAEQSVSIDDWRAVCGILMEHHAQEYADSSDGGEGASRAMSDAGSVFSDGSEGDNPSDDDYQDDEAPRLRRRRTRGNAKEASPDTDDFNDSGIDSRQKRLTPRQRQTCLDAFALFFPDATDDELPHKKIMISDIQRVAQLLKEKLKAEDVSSCASLERGWSDEQT